jgi:feruloyl-CoA synthase
MFENSTIEPRRFDIFGPVQLDCETGPDGSILLSNARPLKDYPPTLLHRLDHWAAATPDSPYIAERAETGWRSLTYLQMRTLVDDYAARLLRLDLNAGNPLLILAANSIDHAATLLAAMRVGLVTAVVSPNYALMGDELTRLREVIDQLTPGAVYLGGETIAAKAMPLLRALGIPLLAPAGHEIAHCVRLADQPAVSPQAVAAAFATVGADSVAKLLFTSGSTGTPKAVVNTHRMMCSNAAGLASAWPFLLRTPPVMLDWLPWNHTFGGNCCFNLALYYGGSFTIDDGKPVGSGVTRTLDNLRSVQPNLYFNVPIGFEALLSGLEQDDALARRFLGGLFFLFNAGAPLPALIRTRLDALAMRLLGRAVPWTGGWGATETGPFSTVVCFETPYADNLGIPMPGTTLKLVPEDGKMELRVRGPNVMPGYWRNADATAASFDEQGFYRIGDAGRFADPQHPEAGLRFDGRIAENFKLNSGTWVNVGLLRLAVLEAIKPLATDLVIAGHQRDVLGILIFPALPACRAALGRDADGLDDLAVMRHPRLIEMLRARLLAHHRLQNGASTRIDHFLLLETPPDRERNEVTEKGALNQRAVLSAREPDVIALFEGSGHPVAGL